MVTDRRGQAVRKMVKGIRKLALLPAAPLRILCLNPATN